MDVSVCCEDLVSQRGGGSRCRIRIGYNVPFKIFIDFLISSLKKIKEGGREEEE